jgi:choline kinase
LINGSVTVNVSWTTIDNLTTEKMNHFPISSQHSKCVILAAGASMRLRPLTDSKPKCLLEIGGKTLLKRIIENVLDAGVKEIAVVIGYRGEMIREFVRQHFPKIHIRFILNPNYTNTNNAYSLLLAKRFLENNKGNVSSGLILLDSDIYFSSKLLPLFLSNSLQDCVAVRVAGKHCEEEIRVKADNYGNIILIGKETPLNETYGESIGIEVFCTETTTHLFTILEQRMRSGAGRTEFYEASFQEMINRGTQLKAIDVSAFPAIEIDTVEDLQLAERMNIV